MIKRCTLLAALLLVAYTSVNAATKDPAVDAARKFLLQYSAGLGEEVRVNVRPASARLPRCKQPTPFLPGKGQNIPGRVTVGVRCGEEGKVRYLQAQVSVFGSYWVSAQPIAAGTPIDASMLRRARGDLGALPRGAILERDRIIGQVASRPLGAGAVMQEQLLKARPLVRRRQPVTLEAQGRGFRIAREAIALEDGAMGEEIRVRLPDRNQVSAIVSGPGLARVKF